jgi:far upstream element-binding protein
MKETQNNQIVADSEINTALQRAKKLTATDGGQKRTNSDDLNFLPIKREKLNGTEDMAGMGMGPPVNETLVDAVDIPESQVGLVIGRGGEQIQLIQQQSGCRVQMAGESGNAGYRQCTLQGPRQCIDRAKALIHDVLERNARSALGIQNGNMTTVELSIPGGKCGLIIGKNGETIKGLQEQIGVKMMLIQDSHQVTMGNKPLRISGIPDKVEQAKRIIESLLAGDASTQPNLSQALRAANGPKSIGEVIVPRSSVGVIIGKSGDTIKRLAAETGAKIQFKPDDPSLQERCAIIQGTPEQISRATQLISELVTRSGSGSQQQETFYMHVPANKTGLVIGKGGDTIKQISGETGAHVELSRDAPPNPNEKVFVIRGTPYQIHHVQHIIRIKVGDIAPGTPLPPFHTGSVTATLTAAPVAAPLTTVGNPYGPTSHPQTFNAAPAQQVQDPSVWNQYYNQQQAGFAAATANAAPQQTFANAAAQQHYQPMPGAMNTAVSQTPQLHPQVQQHHQAHQMQQHAMAQPQQQISLQGAPTNAASMNNAGGGSAPAINPQTGQPDYSVQWAEYYRTMGMHSQAEIIEQQIKQNRSVVQQHPQQQLYM